MNLRFRTVLPVFLLICGFFAGASLSAQQSAASAGQQSKRQGQVQVDVTRNSDGQSSTEHDAVDVAGHPNVLELLQDLDLIKEFGVLEDGEILSITIERKKKGLPREETIVEMDPKIKGWEEGDPWEESPAEEVASNDADPLHGEGQPAPFNTSQGDIKPPFLGVYYEYDNIPEKESYRLGILQGHGVLLSSIIPKTAASISGLLPGDIVTSINGEPVTPENFERIIESYNQGDRAEVQFYRDAVRRRAIVTFGEIVPEDEKQLKQLQKEDAAIAQNLSRKDFRRKLKAFRRGEEIPGITIKKDEEEEAWVYTKPVEKPKESKIKKTFNKPKGPVYKLNPAEKKVKIVMRMEELNSRERQMLDLGSPAQGNPQSDDEMNIRSINFYPDGQSHNYNLNCILLEPGAVEVQVMNSRGKQVYSQKSNHFGGEFASKINLAANDTKTFFLTLRQNDRTFSRKVVMQ